MLARARAAGLQRGDLLIVAFSGGRDSLALAVALRHVRATLDVDPHLVHVDHRLRPTSGADATRAGALAESLEMPFAIVTVPLSPRQIFPGVGVEEAARRARYALLGQAAHEHGAAAVVTAHHQEDQAETVLLHLLRGGGVHGAAGMAEWGPLPTQDVPSQVSDVLLWRPFLQERRDDLAALVQCANLTPIEDPSNADTTLRRNLLRLRILPVLQEGYPGAAAALARYASLAAEDDQALDTLAGAALPDTLDDEGNFTGAVLRCRPLALQRRIVRKWLLQYSGSAAFSADRTEAVRRLALAGRGGAVVELGEGWLARRVGGVVRLEPMRERSGEDGHE